jgi:hypothetical protein
MDAIFDKGRPHTELAEIISNANLFVTCISSSAISLEASSGQQLLNYVFNFPRTNPFF